MNVSFELQTLTEDGSLGIRSHHKTGALGLDGTGNAGGEDAQVPGIGKRQSCLVAQLKTGLGQAQRPEHEIVLTGEIIVAMGIELAVKFDMRTAEDGARAL